MIPSQSDGPEQLTVNLLFNGAHEDFTQAIKSASVEFVLWRSFATAEELKKNYLNNRFNKKHLIDQRRKKSESDREFLAILDIHCTTAADHQKWLENDDRQPILRETIVRYCTALENFFKKIALGFKFANNSSKGFEKEIFILSSDFRRIRKEVNAYWSSSDKDHRQKSFFEDQILSQDYNGNFIFDLISDAEWNSVKSAFELRNAFVHQFGILSNAIHMFDDGPQYYAGDKPKISPADLAKLRLIFLKFAAPFCPLRDAF
jgi:hypothetical protein